MKSDVFFRIGQQGRFFIGKIAVRHPLQDIVQQLAHPGAGSHTQGKEIVAGDGQRL